VTDRVSTIEQTALSNGFQIALLEVRMDRASGSTALQAKLFNGGREIENVRHVDCPRKTSLPIERLSKLIYKVIAPPHLLAIYGHGSLPLLHSIFSQRIALFRILDVRRTAIALHPTLSSQAATPDILRAYALPYHEDESLLFSEAVERLLWTILAEAGRRHLTWDELLHFADAARSETDFSRCAFDAHTLLELPEGPAVYAMYDKHNRLLYVGKSANLRRRMSEYFSPSLRPSAKTQIIRSEVADIAFHLAGSELEALLLENHLITTQQPAVNVQRHMAEGRSRYNAPFFSIVVVTRSAREGAADAFFLAASRPAYQYTFLPRGKPPSSLMRLIAHFIADAPAPRPNVSLRNWGDMGREIGLRFFGARRHALHWRELTPLLLNTDGWTALREMARAALSEETRPAWYRDGAFDAEPRGYDGPP
jgi:hypothetical protein